MSIAVCSAARVRAMRQDVTRHASKLLSVPRVLVLRALTPCCCYCDCCSGALLLVAFVRLSVGMLLRLLTYERELARAGHAIASASVQLARRGCF